MVSSKELGFLNPRSQLNSTVVTYFYKQQTQTNPSGRSGPPLLVNTKIHWGQLKYLSSTTSQPNARNRTKALATINKQVRDLPPPPQGKRGRGKVPHRAIPPCAYFCDFVYEWFLTMWHRHQPGPASVHDCSWHITRGPLRLLLHFWELYNCVSFDFIIKYDIKLQMQ